MVATMKAARWHGRRDVRVEEVPVPVVGPADLLLRVRWCGICGTDVEEYRDGPVVIPAGEPNAVTGQHAPVVMGHEFCGQVVAVGRDVTGFAVGDRVAPEICLFCGVCHHCRRHEYSLCLSWATLGFHGDGGLAEFARVPAALCQPLPERVSDEEGALIETVEVAVRAIRRVGVRLGDSVAVIGDGAVGLISAQVARAAGATRVILLGHRPARLEVGRALGVDGTVDTRDPGWHDALLELTDGLGADVAVECGGRPSAVEDAIRATRKGGRIVLLAVLGTPAPIDTWAIVAGERTLTGSVQHHFDEDLPAAVRLLATGRVQVGPLITRRVPLERIVEDGFATLAAGGDDIKVLVETSTPS